jgi:hypothetical protein
MLIKQSVAILCLCIAPSVVAAGAAPMTISGNAYPVIWDDLAGKNSKTTMQVQSAEGNYAFDVVSQIGRPVQGTVVLEKTSPTKNTRDLVGGTFLRESKTAQTFQVVSSSSASATPSVSIGTNNVLVLVMPAAANGVSPTELERRLNSRDADSLKSFFASSSRGRLNMNFSKFYLTGSDSECLSGDDETYLIPRFEKQFPNVDVRGFDTILLLAKGGSCAGDFSGRATTSKIPFKTSRGIAQMAQAGIYFTADMVAFSFLARHELGHTLGLLHSGKTACDSHEFTANCIVYERDDPTTVMGTHLTNYNPYQHYLLGWLDNYEVARPTNGVIYVGGSTPIGLIDVPSPFRFGIMLGGRTQLLLERTVNASDSSASILLRVVSSASFTTTLVDFGASNTAPLSLTNIGDVVTLPGLRLRLTLTDISPRSGQAQINIETLSGNPNQITAVQLSTAKSLGLADGRCVDRTVEFSNSAAAPTSIGVDYFPDQPFSAYKFTGPTAIGGGRFRARFNDIPPQQSGVFTFLIPPYVDQAYVNATLQPCNEQPLAATATVEFGGALAGQPPRCDQTIVNTQVTGLSGYGYAMTPSGGGIVNIGTTPVQSTFAINRDTRFPRQYWFQARNQDLAVQYDPARYCANIGPVPALSIAANWNKSCTAVQVRIETANQAIVEPVWLQIVQRSTGQTLASTSPNVTPGVPYLASYPVEIGTKQIRVLWNEQEDSAFLPTCVSAAIAR